MDAPVDGPLPAAAMVTMAPGDQRHLTAAQGYHELGMHLDADAELEEIEPEQRDGSDVLALRVRIYAALQKWEAMRVVAKALALRDPGNPQWSVSWAYATRRSDSLEAARLILVNAVEMQPDVAVFHFNPACYECQLGLIDAARRRLQRAFELELRYRLRALYDSDLEPLWEL